MKARIIANAVKAIALMMVMASWFIFVQAFRGSADDGSISVVEFHCEYGVPAERHWTVTMQAGGFTLDKPGQYMGRTGNTPRRDWLLLRVLIDHSTPMESSAFDHNQFYSMTVDRADGTSQTRTVPQDDQFILTGVLLDLEEVVGDAEHNR